ncbi:MAG: murein hydrolase activator EnvC family protein [Actinomycetota bacterium]
MIPALVAALAMCLLPPVDAPVSRPFEAPACQWCAGHRGIEFATGPGTPVRAAAAGTVTFAGVVAGERYVVVQHADGIRATYGGLAPPTAAQGQRVARGAFVGRTAGPLHFGLRSGETYLDPAGRLPVRVGRPRLVPVNGVGRRPGGSSVSTCTAEVRGRGSPR